MKKLFAAAILLLILVVAGILFERKYLGPRKARLEAEKQVTLLVDSNQIREGDIIFQTSLSGQSRAIQLATHSVYSHCGVIFKNGEDWVVFEAVEPVKWTPLAQWIQKGKDGIFIIKRLKNVDGIMTATALTRMKQKTDLFNGKHYDLYFEWSDDKIYCSELVWKLYQSATGLELGKLEQLKDFDLTNSAVKAKMKDRYGDHIPFNEIVISPSAIFNSDLLITVAMDK